jgi:homoserine O-acetyltransferase
MRRASSAMSVTISPRTVTGHAAAGGGFPADVDHLNRESASPLDRMTQDGARLK